MRRQAPIGPYFADFYGADHRLILEADGGGHGGSRDNLRDRWLAAQGFRILRFWNPDILSNLSGCLDLIAAEAAPPVDPPPPI